LGETDVSYLGKNSEASDFFSLLFELLFQIIWEETTVSFNKN